MDQDILDTYNHIRSGGSGFYNEKRGLIAVWGKEAVQFLDGLISNDMKTLGDGEIMLAAFPNAQGRLLAVVRVRRQGDRYLFETEEAMREKVFTNLFRFTFAGDFFVEDLSDSYAYFELFNMSDRVASSGGVNFGESSTIVESESVSKFRDELLSANAAEISNQLHEILRIESGTPRYGIDMDDTTIVPELGLDGLISYNKGCYIGQEIIARIHFRGHVAKRLTGLVLSEPPAVAGGLTSPSSDADTNDALVIQSSEGKNAGRMTSSTYSPNLEKTIALAYVRYDYLAAGTELTANGIKAIVTDLPFISPMV